MSEPNSLDVLRNRHKGQAAYIVASGASLRGIDVQKIISKGVSFVVNEASMILDSFDYYLFTDYAVPQMSYFKPGVEKCDALIFGTSQMTNLFNKIKKEKKYIFNRRLDDHANYKFSIIDTKLCVGNDCVHVATHLAYLCGCNPIILLGVDMCWIGENMHCADWSQIKHKGKPFEDQYNKKDHFVQEKDGIKTHLGFRHSMNIWATIARHNKDNKSLKIINASPISLMPYFKRTTYEKLLTKKRAGTHT